MSRYPRAVCVYCGSRSGVNPAWLEAATALGAGLAGRGIDLVYGGGNVGLMRATADAAMAAGGRVIGVIPYDLEVREHGHRAVTELHVVDSMHERKLLMAKLSDAFVSLPGGLGTLEDCIETTEQFAYLGVSHLILAPCCDPEETTAQTEQFGREVVPHFKGAD